MDPFTAASPKELIAAITGADSSDQLLQRYPTLTSLAKASFDELLSVKGIGPSKAASIKAAFLLAQRLSAERLPESPLLDTPDRVADVLRERFRMLTTEEFHIVMLNTRRRLIGIHKVSQGTLDTLLVLPRQVFEPAIVHHAAALALAHNHPSGDPSPSESDIRFTRDLVRAGQVLKIEVVDHIILGCSHESRASDFVSLRSLGYFY